MFPIAEARPVPWFAPADAFVRLAHRHGVFWLDSSLLRPTDARFSIMGCDPRSEFSARGDRWQIRDSGGAAAAGVGVLSRFDRWLAAGRAEADSDAAHLPFFGGAVGWISYDFGRRFESSAAADSEAGPPELWFGWYDVALVWDHEAGVLWRVSSGRDESTRRRAEALEATARHGRPAEFGATAARPAETTSNLSQREYEARVALVREGIARGEFYQLNLLQQFTCRHTEPAAATYLRLRTINPAPFSAFVATQACAVLSSSPERLVTVTPDRQVCTCPIKGTRPRGATPEADAALKAELLGSEKERAELLMIVDLARNDLGRVCVPGSIEVPRLHALESFATVHHLVGDVRGRLREDVTPGTLLRAVFPGGSITGAPKVSAMDAIARLEPDRRGLAMGSIGYFSAHGRADLNIAIRTIVVEGGHARFGVGAGIVWDSDPAAEYAETLTKAAALLAALGGRRATS